MIGINDYQNSKRWKSLDGCENDVNNLNEVLKNQHGFTQSVKLTPKATRNGIISVLHDSFKNELDNNGRLIIYFAGHAETHNNTHYLIPSDCQNIAIDGIKTSDFMQSLFNREDKIDLPKHILFIQGHGLFTQFFIEGLSGKAFEKDWMTTNELTIWIENEIEKKKKEMKNEELLTQIPNLHIYLQFTKNYFI